MQTIATPKNYVAVLEQLVTERLIREAERKCITGMSRAHWARLEQANLAPKHIHCGERIAAWRLTDLMRWVELTARGEKWSESAEPVEAA